jgi:CRISPR/Cas system-associated exonuclease Cas4 (RecB family)
MTPSDYPMPGHKPSLTASEVGRYTYCARAWWLQRVLGYAPENEAALARGTQRHQLHGRLVRRARWQMRTVWGLLLAALALLGIFAYLWLK